ncbi:DoxX family protein [Cellulosimicrobium funkei]|uniref:DoxX family protein n=1 Tax=Cellulosimicrobium funkei TaxID=264251 RepID=A0A4Y8R0R8_9MICO|nr:DoxX family protein [Cellulosimicrobium funkei]TFF10311.1 DoxX family protein [Cellulosimicrobium funkei]TGA73796.1 DoxX family protein [Cellulosimicrobium terreum]
MSTSTTSAPPSATPGAAARTTDPVTQDDVVTRSSARHALALTRIGTALVFLWPFTDKLVGLGYATPRERAWLAGGAPTQGYLENGAQGPLASTFAAMASPVTDWLFMLGLLGVGLALLLGIGLRVAAVSGTVLFAMLWLSQWPLAAGSNNPVVDDHVLVILLLAVLATTLAGDTWGLGRRWAALPLVRRAAWLR